MNRTPRRKLIEVALPLEAINAASAREKSIRHGHPSTLHLWWARRPLAACRAVLFAQLVDDPSSVPEEFPDEAAQERERRRLFRIVEELVRWENSNDPRVVAAARREIARSVARGRGDAPPRGRGAVDAYLAENAPPVLDPFCGGGSIPLEAQRLGLRVCGSDLNPVAVLITKALVEIPPRFAGLPPVNPEARVTLAAGAAEYGKGAQGLAEDVRHYGRWMRDEAEKRIGHLYPKARLPDGSEATAIAWLWARTVASPNPAAGGAHVPLVRSFVLSSRKGGKAWVEPIIDHSANTCRLTVRTGSGTPPDGTVGRRGGRCLLTGSPMPFTHIRSEGRAGRMGQRLMAVVAEGTTGRIYLDPTDEMEATARAATPSHRPDNELPHNPRDFKTPNYGMKTFADLFTDRQLVALTTFSDLVGEAREKVKRDYLKARTSETHPDDDTPLVQGGTAAQAYADAVATYLGLCVSRQANRSSNLNFWDPGGAKVQQVFARQALPMVWDFCEANPFSDSSGSFVGQVGYLAKVVQSSPPAVSGGSVSQEDATSADAGQSSCVVATDPPYYDNIGYADLSDFFYVWLRRALGKIHPDLFRTVLTPKSRELVATPYRFDGSRQRAQVFFQSGFRDTMKGLRTRQDAAFPLTLYYAFKQAETKHDGDGSGSTVSTGWETMLTGIIEAGFTVEGTWPVRTELAHNLKKQVAALASSIVLACRPRPDDAPVATRRDFTAALRRELPGAIRRLQAENIAPVDLAQAAIGPGMAVFSRYAQVLEADGAAMPVRQALVEINRVLDETLAEAEGDMDADTRFCVAWFEQYGTAERAYGEAEVLFTAKNTSFAGLEKAGVLVGGGGKVRLRRRDELDRAWDPATDDRIADWECVQHLVRAMTAEASGGVAEAARLLTAMGPARAQNAHALAYRLHTVSGRKGWSGEALAYNILIASWPQIQAEAAQLAGGGPAQEEMEL